MSVRCNIMPDARFLELRGALLERLAAVAASLQPESFASLLDPLMRHVLDQGFAGATAHEGTVWLLDATCKNLVPVFNNGPDARRIVGKFQQPLDAGLISMVFATEQPFVENAVNRNVNQSKLLDNLLGVETAALIATPLCFAKACRGVVSCVQLRRSAQQTDPTGFSPAHLASVQAATALLSQLIEFRLLSQTVGWTLD